MNNFVTFYIALSPLIILFSARAVAVSREYKRMPFLIEIVRAPAGVNEKDTKWLHAAQCFFIGGLVFFL